MSITTNFGGCCILGTVREGLLEGLLCVSLSFQMMNITIYFRGVRILYYYYYEHDY
jgi:hypothetical protein